MATTYAQLTPAFVPPQPSNAAGLGIPWSLVLDLVTRRLHIDGVTTLANLQDVLKLPPVVVESVFRHLQKEQMAEIRGMSGSEFMISLTNAGRQLALDRMKVSLYAGPAPISLRAYHEAVRAQAARPHVNRASMTEALGDLVVEDELLDQLGPAVVSQKSIFLFGSTGNGKTSIAERFARVYQDAIVVPYAIEVDGQIIVVFDPVIHEPLHTEVPGLDARWVVCRRPEVMVGGELTAEMLELRLDARANIYSAPVQMKANNGVLVVDDFGRQVMTPSHLLNRWIVPLDRRVDYLTLGYGLKFDVPFVLMLVFATNLQPTKLLDKAFLRRVPNKIYVRPVSERSFHEIFRLETLKRGLETTDELTNHLISLCRQQGGRWLRACYPRDICDIIVSIDEYEERPTRIDRDQLQRAVNLYFAEHIDTEEGSDMT